MTLQRLMRLCAAIGSLMLILDARAKAREGAAHADSRLVFSLKWHRAPEAAKCMNETSLARAVEQRLGRPVFAASEGASVVVINGVAARDGARGAWRATLTLSRAAGDLLGQRQLTSTASACGPLGEMVVLAVTLMIAEADRLASLEAPSTAAPPRVIAEDPAPAQPAGIISARGSQPWSWETEGDVAATLTVGPLPGAAAGVRVRGQAWPVEGIALELEAAMMFASDAHYGADSGAHFWVAWVGSAVCPFEHRTDVWRLRSCAGVAIGDLFFRPFGTDVVGVQERLLLLGRGGGTLERALGPSWFLVGGAEILVPLLRDRFEIRDADSPHTLFQMSRVGMMGSVGMGRRF